jgi:SOS-response transcriptional repressor LexA
MQGAMDEKSPSLPWDILNKSSHLLSFLYYLLDKVNDRLLQYDMGYAGFPTFEEEEHDLISLDEYFTQNLSASFMAHIKDNHLSRIGILKGDIVVIEKTVRTHHGDVLLVTIDNTPQFFRSDSIQGKTVFRTLDTFKLVTLPEEGVQMLGVIKGLIRKY